MIFINRQKTTQSLSGNKMKIIMPRKTTLKLPIIDLGDETLGQRITRYRKENGLTQVQLAKKIGIIQSLVSEYEHGHLRPHPEMLARFALALNVSTDDLIGLNKPAQPKYTPSLRFLKRIKEIEELPESQQKILLKTIDTFLKAEKN